MIDCNIFEEHRRVMSLSLGLPDLTQSLLYLGRSSTEMMLCPRYIRRHLQFVLFLLMLTLTFWLKRVCLLNLKATSSF